MSDGDFEKRVEEELCADLRMKSLLPILDEQVNTLAKEGRTNLSLFVTSLESRGLVMSEDAMELRAKFGPVTVSHDASSRSPHYGRV